MRFLLKMKDAVLLTWFAALCTAASATLPDNETVYTQTVGSGGYMDVAAWDQVDTSGSVVIDQDAKSNRMWSGFVVCS